MGIIRASLALVWLLVFATSAAAQKPPTAQDDAHLQGNSAPQSPNVPQEGSTAKGYFVGIKIVQGRRLLERQEFPRGTVIAELVPGPSVTETATGSIAVKHGMTYDDWDIFVDAPEINVLASPTIRTPENVAVNFQVHNKTAFSYLVPTRDGTFRLEKTPPQELGLKLDFTVKSIADASQSVELSPIEVSQTALDGRETIPGVDLNVGKPNISTRSIKTTAKVPLGQTRIITISADPERQVLLLLNVKRAEK